MMQDADGLYTTTVETYATRALLSQYTTFVVHGFGSDGAYLGKTTVNTWARAVSIYLKLERRLSTPVPVAAIVVTDSLEEIAFYAQSFTSEALVALQPQGSAVFDDLDGAPQAIAASPGVLYALEGGAWIDSGRFHVGGGTITSIATSGFVYSC